MASRLKMLVGLYEHAKEAHRALADIQQQGIPVIDAVVMKKDDFGNTEVEEIEDPGAEQGRNFGAVIGALLGIIGGIPGGAAGSVIGGVIGGAAGAAVGGLSAGVIDTGIDNAQLQDIINRMKHNTSVLILVTRVEYTQPSKKLMKAPQHELIEYDLDVSVSQEEKE